jgi:hypothetical protein
MTEIQATEPMTDEQVDELKRQATVRWSIPSGNYERVLVISEGALHEFAVDAEGRLEAGENVHPLVRWAAESARACLGGSETK